MKGPTKAKNDRKGAYKGKKMRKKGPTKVKMRGIEPLKKFSPQIFKKCLVPTRALIRPWL
jgi:hypothetical protein